jgi:hypothetical protein
MIVITSYNEFYANFIRKLSNERLARRIAPIVYAKYRSDTGGILRMLRLT